MVSSFLLFRDDKVNVALGLALFVIFARTDLGAFFGLTVSVLEAPVPNLEVTSSRVLLSILVSVKLFMLVIHAVSQMIRDAITDMSVRVGDLT